MRISDWSSDVCSSDLATITRADLLARLEAATVPAGPINDIADVFDDPQVRHRNMRSDLPHPAAAGGSVPGLRTPIVLDGRPMMHPGRSPMLGEHGDAVRDDPDWS